MKTIVAILTGGPHHGQVIPAVPKVFDGLIIDGQVYEHLPFDDGHAEVERVYVHNLERSAA